MGQVKVAEPSGEEVHAKLFERKELKTPAYWKKIIEFF
jgi:hypothetical protein